jgi:DNA ligase (NAD+)
MLKLVCPNISCPDQIKGRITKLFDALGIESISFSGIEQLVDNGTIKSPFDVFGVTKEQLSALPRQGGTLTTKTIKAIQSHKDIPLAVFLEMCSIPYFQSKAVEPICNRFKTLKAVRSASLDDFYKIEGVTNHSANCIYDYLNRDSVKKELDAFLENCEKWNVTVLDYVELKKDEVVIMDNKLEGMIICVTGKLSQKRDDIHKMIVQYGGKVATSVTKKTTHLVVGEDAGSKLTKAEELKINILTEDQFLTMVQ